MASTNRQNITLLFSTVFFLITPLKLSSKNIYLTDKDDKGLLTLQFSWSKELFNNVEFIEIAYKKKGFFIGNNNVGKCYSTFSEKKFIDIELEPGEYKLIAIRLYFNQSTQEHIRIPVNCTFEIIKSQVTKGGMLVFHKKNDKYSLDEQFIEIEESYSNI